MGKNANVLTRYYLKKVYTGKAVSQVLFGGVRWFGLDCLFVFFGRFCFLFVCLLLCMNVLYVLCRVCFRDGQQDTKLSDKIKNKKNYRLLEKMLGFHYMNHLVHY